MSSFAILVVAGLLSGTIVTPRDHLLLHADFNAETVGSAPNLGGAAAGEPISNDSALIGLAPLPTPNLQIRNNNACCAQTTWFGFLGNEEVVSGTVQIRAKVRFSGASQPAIGLREQGGATQTFLDLYSGNDASNLYAYVGNNFQGTVGYFTPGAIAALEIDASADHKLVSVRLDGATLLDQAPIGLTTARGIGSLLLGVLNGASLTSDVMRVDDVRATACVSTVFADCVFLGGFEG